MSSAARMPRWSSTPEYASVPVRSIVWTGLTRPSDGYLLFAPCGPCWSKLSASEITLPLRTSRAAATLSSGVVWLSVPISSSAPHRPQLLYFSAASARSLRVSLRAAIAFLLVLRLANSSARPGRCRGGVDAVALQGFAGARIPRRVQRRDGDRMAVHLEEAAQVGARVAAAEAVGAERDVRIGDPRADEVGNGADVVACGDDGDAIRGELLLHPGWIPVSTGMTAAP